MPRYAAFLRGVMPTNCKMSALKAAFEAAGFTDVKTILGSGNVVFTAPRASESSLERKAEVAMQKHLGRSFMTIVRPVKTLNELLARDPYKAFGVKPGAKRVVTLLREPPSATIALPVEQEGACIHAIDGREIYTSYVPGPKTPVFMTLIEKTFGKDVTTRTWDTIAKVTR